MTYDVIIIGGGHAGCEAALAAARMGAKTIMFAINLDSIAMMPCNPNIGGTSKGHLVREIDALGGEMGRNIDKTFIQSRMLNKGKGPAVHSLRAQADKKRYSSEMKKTLENTENLEIYQSEVVNLLVENGVLTGVVTEMGTVYHCKSAVICSGTYLNARCLCGDVIVNSGPNGLRNSVKLTEDLKNFGVKMFRFKTGTPARVDKRSIDFSRMSAQEGDEPVTPFSFENESLSQIEQQKCWLTYTNEKTHDVIKENIHRSPMFSGLIEGTGTRYCPSIEDKISRFADKDRHQIFIEPEGLETNEMYVQGMSTSLPEDVQQKMLRTVPGLENCRIMRNGYAIEYDCIDATQLLTTLEFINIRGLYAAGQINGSSGYEEAAAQGLVAGINAALAVKGEESLVLDRSDAYIGVLIDDIVVKGTAEPYRMMTSRAEYRLLLRQDNADLRLTEKGYRAGLVSQDRFERFLKKKEDIANEIKRVEKAVITPCAEVNKILENAGTTPVSTGIAMSDLIKRPELDYNMLKEIDPLRPKLPEAVTEQVSISIKYDGYIKRQNEQIERFKKLEDKKIPENIDYGKVKHLRIEARQKLATHKPENIGQASRIAGVSPADITMLMVYLT